MKFNAALSWLAGSLILGCPLVVVPARGQITPDTTLGTLVNGVTTGCNAATCTITGGVTNANNLFHSFSEFSLLGNQAFFDNVTAIDNIFARVTGTSISNIDGIISANGTANLFLLNPNGIIFGSSAQLNIGGSFLATTAEAITFSDGAFSATNPGNSVLSMNVPLGVQFGSAAGSITNRSQATRNGQIVGLEVFSGNTLALLGGALNLEGGSVTASQGTIELGSVGDNSFVNLTLDGDNLSLDYPGVQNFQDINLSQNAVVSTSGGRGINIQGRQLRVTQGSQIATDTGSADPAGNVQVNATELVEITGSALDGNNNIIFSTISARSNGGGNGGDININTKKLSIQGGGDVSVSSLLIGGPGIPGNITVNASEEIELDGVGFNGFNPSQFSRSGLFAANSGIGDASGSSITVNTPQLTILNGARISTSTRGPEQNGVPGGDGGNVIVNAQSIELSGVFISGDGQTFNSGLFAQSGEQLSGIFTPGGTPLNAQDATGNGGNITVNAGQLIVRDGAEVSTTSFGSGDGGDIFVTSDTTQVSGSALNGQGQLEFSTISARARGTGSSGNITIDTRQLVTRDGADVSVSLLGQDNGGIPGNLTVNASESVELLGAATNPNDPTQFSRSGLFAATNGTGDASVSSLTINTPRLIVGDGARVSTATRGGGQNGVAGGRGANLVINASESIELSGSFTSSDGQTFNSGLFAQSGEELSSIFTQANTPLTTADATGNGGNITVNTGQLIVRDGAEISTTSFGSGDGGDILVTSDTVQVSGSTLNGQGRLEFSTISARARGTGNSGNITINTRQLVTRDGADVSVSLLGEESTGIPGNLTVNASESVELLGAATNPNDPTQFSRSGLFAATNGTGDASGRNLTINTPRLIVRDGARVSTATRGAGQNGVAGGRGANLVVNASESIELSGSFTSSDGQVFQSGLFAQSGEELSSLFIGTGAGGTNLGDDVASGDGGNLTVNTNLLEIREGAAISVGATGSGVAGNLNIMANSLRMDNGFITGTTALGTGGNITIRIGNGILRNNSQISTTGGGMGDGGNITITGKNLDPADFLALLENSDITSNAFQGNGGRISINVRGLFTCSDCDITAASSLGIDGEVELNTPETQESLEVFEPSEDVLDSQDVVAQVCQPKQGDTAGKFIRVGRGGLPTSPSDPLSSNIVTEFDIPPENVSLGAEPPEAQEELPLPAQGWYVNEEGEVIFTAEVLTHPQKPLSTSADCHS
ncbi:MAG: filamentous hemagglutinin N-terminal domain-containing protein [Symploca sp. SIO1C2]|nr:filamentous hemagglutinin N-terminal domain-containing protein [Symploca sp. SIO1C2]